jgi:hypothetical protein
MATEVWGSGGKTVTIPKKSKKVRITSPSIPEAASRYQKRKKGNYGKATVHGSGGYKPAVMPDSWEEKPTDKPKDKKSTTGNYGKTVNYGTGTTPKKKVKAAQAAAERRSEVGQRAQGKRKGDTKRSVSEIESRLKSLKKSGNFKGKFVGPDRFKGDLKKVAAWRAAGRKY